MKALNEKMEEFVLEGEGLLARAICHECDHLYGVLYVDKVEGELEDVMQISRKNKAEAGRGKSRTEPDRRLRSW